MALVAALARRGCERRRQIQPCARRSPDDEPATWADVSISPPHSNAIQATKMRAWYLRIANVSQ